MEVCKTLRGTPDQFFALLMEALKRDVEQATHKVCSSDLLKEGFHYQKMMKNKMGRSGKVRVDIARLSRQPYVYEAAFSSAQGVNTLFYCAKAIDDGYIQVTYREDFTSLSRNRNLNYKIMSKLYQRSSIRKANLILDQLQYEMEK